MKNILLFLVMLIMVSLPVQADEFIDAIGDGDLQKIKSMVAEKSGLVHMRDERGHTALQYAAFEGHTDILNFFIEKEVKINETDKRGYNALHWCAYNNKSATAEILIKHQIDIDHQNNKGMTPLHLAVSRGHLELTRLLLAGGAKTGLTDENGNNLAHLAVYKNRPKIVGFLLNQGIDFNAINNHGDQPIHGIGWSGNKEIAALLLNAGIDLNTKNRSGKTAVDYAKRAGKTGMADYLKTNGGISGNPETIQAAIVNQTKNPDQFKITILYDNYKFQENTKPDWGFSCLVQCPDMNILFDTGTDPEILWHNIGETGVDVSTVDKIILSHIHHDHVGGLSSVLEKRKNYQVYVPRSFPFDFIRKTEEQGSEITAVNEPLKIAKNVWLTGEMGTQIKEHSMILDTPKGLVVITGCSHPGIVEIVKRAKEIMKKEVYLVFGGFHLMQKDDDATTSIADELKKLGVKKCGASHCTGEKQIDLIKKSFGEDYMPMGTGRIIQIDI